MRATLLLFTICLINNFTFGQNVKEWYWPDRACNKVTFYTPDINTGQPTKATRIIYYVKNGYLDKSHHAVYTSYEIIDIQLVNKEPGLVDKKIIEFVSNEVKIKRTERQIIGTNKINTSDIMPAQTIFKVPQKGHTADWVINGEKVTASWAKIKTEDISEEAIKVVQYTPEWDTSTIQYYVKGYGLVATLILKGKSTMRILDKFHQKLFDESLYKDDLSKNTTFNFLKTDDIFNGIDPQSYTETQSKFSLIEKVPKNNVSSLSENYTNRKLIGPLVDIPKYEQMVINNRQPNLEGVQTNYDDKDFRVIIWNDKLFNKTLYNNKALKDLGYDYMGVTQSDSRHKTYSYRNCEKNLTLDLTEWFDLKLSIFVSWFSDVVKNSSGRFIGCSSTN